MRGELGELRNIARILRGIQLSAVERVEFPLTGGKYSGVCQRHGIK